MMLSKAFWISLCVMIILFFVPFLLTMSAPNRDGQAKWGFPLFFASYGGETLNGTMYSAFSVWILILDLLIMIAVPLIVNMFYKKNMKK
jgi:hypothetical protein